MTPNRFHRRRSTRRPERDSLAPLFEQLRREQDTRPAKEPDVADRVLSRLGYRATDPRGARWARIATAARRFAATATLFAFTAASLWWIDAATRRAADGSAIPDIVSTSLRENRDRLMEFAGSISPFSNLPRNQSPSQSAPAGDGAPDFKSVKDHALAPFRKA